MEPLSVISAAATVFRLMDLALFLARDVKQTIRSPYGSRNTAGQTLERRSESVEKNYLERDEDDWKCPAVTPAVKVNSKANFTNICWRFTVEHQKRSLAKLVLLKQGLPHLPEDMLRSENIARMYLQACWDTLQEVEKSGIRSIREAQSHVIDGLGAVWPKHYRDAERYSDALPAMLDQIAQLWAQQRAHEDDHATLNTSLDTQNQRSPLHLCSALGFEGLGEVYLQMGKDPNKLAYPDGQSALQLAAAGGHMGMMRLLLDRDADIEQRTLLTGRSALQLAAFRGHEDAVKFLLEEGADVDAKDKFGQTALTLAAANGHMGVATLLRAFYADEMTWLGGWEREGAPMGGEDNFVRTQLNDQDSVEVHMPDRTSTLYKCPLGKECTSWSSPVSRHQDYLRHIHEKHPTPETMSNDCDEQQRRFWSCCKCGEGPKCCRCDDQTRCFDCGGPAKSSEVDEGWIAVDHQKCTHMHCPNCHENRQVV
jgi:hypothetical protein